MVHSRYASLHGLLVAGLVVFAAACDLGNSQCVSDVECTVPGEICLPTSNRCGCEPASVGGTDTCTDADPTTACHPVTGSCVAKCLNNDDCTAGEICDPQASVCRTVSCEDPGNECDSTKVCDPVSKGCIDPCSVSGCVTGEICNTVTELCVADCNTAGCGAGQTCDTASGICVDACGVDSCGIDEVCGLDGQCITSCLVDPGLCTGSDVCDDTTGLCDPGCDMEDTNIVCDPVDEVCSTTTGLCIQKCTGNIDCAGAAGFCNLATGLCETVVDITECNPEGEPADPREYVDPATNMCTSTAQLATCTRGSTGRDSGNEENANGPTIYRAESVARTESVEHCSGAPEVQFYAEYYDPTGGVSASSGLYSSVFQQVSGTDSNTAGTVERCGITKSDGYCAGISSDGTRGAFLFTLCRPASAKNEIVAIYMKDGQGNFGNSICIELKAAHDI